MAQIPAGRVTTYGRLASLAGLPRRARWVGQQLKKLPADSNLPWHRVVRADGGLTQGETQAALLAREQINSNALRVSLADYGWP